MFTIRHVLPNRHIEDYDKRRRNMFSRFIDDSPFYELNGNILVDESAFFVSKRPKHFSLVSSLRKFKRTYALGYNVIYCPLYVPIRRMPNVERKFFFRLSNTDMDYFEKDHYGDYKDFPMKSEYAYYFDGIGRTHSLITYFLTAAIRSRNIIFVNSDRITEEFEDVVRLSEELFEGEFFVAPNDTGRETFDNYPFYGFRLHDKYVEEFINFDFEDYLIDYLDNYKIMSDMCMSFKSDSTAIRLAMLGK